MACPVVYERQVLRLGPVNQHQAGNRAKERKAKSEKRQERAGPVRPRWSPKSAVSDYIVSPRFGRLGTDALGTEHTC